MNYSFQLVSLSTVLSSFILFTRVAPATCALSSSRESFRLHDLCKWLWNFHLYHATGGKDGKLRVSLTTCWEKGGDLKSHYDQLEASARRRTEGRRKKSQKYEDKVISRNVYFISLMLLLSVYTKISILKYTSNFTICLHNFLFPYSTLISASSLSKVT